jgi:CTP:molybdopterin cytidylyltransferase MocA
MEARRAEPRDDLITRAVQARIDGVPVPDDVTVMDLFLVVAGGADTTVALISHALVHLHRDHDLRARLIADPSLIPDALEELSIAGQIVDRPGVAATLVTLVDVPLVSAATVGAVLRQYERTHALVVRPTRGDEHGHPLLVGRSLFHELRLADPSLGAKPVVRAHITVDSGVEVDDAGAFADIDTPGDYEQALTSLGRSGG